MDNVVRRRRFRLVFSQVIELLPLLPPWREMTVIRGLCKVRGFGRSKSFLTRPERDPFRSGETTRRRAIPGETERPLGEMMKKTATTMMLLAGFGGGCVSPNGDSGQKTGQPGGYGTVTRQQAIPGFQGPGGEPVSMMPVAARGVAPGGVQQAGYQQPQPKTLSGSMNVQQAGFKKAAECTTCAHVPGGVTTGAPMGGPMPGPGYGPQMPYTRGGIMPVPGQGAPGASANFGAIVPGMGGGPGMGGPGVPSNMRTSIRFTGPAGMKITWQLPGGGFNDEAHGLTAPKDYNFLQGQIYRLRLSQILPNFPGRTFYPTLEVKAASPKTVTFLSHSNVPLTFTNEDFDQVVAGNLVIKVIYLPDPTFQDFAVVAGAEEIVSTRLEPGADPEAEAQRRGTILAVIRIGNIDLENRASPAINAVPGGFMGGPGMLPPGAMPGRPGALPPGVANVNTPVAPALPSPIPNTLPGGSFAPSIPTAPVAPLPVTPTAPTTTVTPSLPVAPMPPLAGGKDAKPATLPNINGK